MLISLKNKIIIYVLFVLILFAGCEQKRDPKVHEINKNGSITEMLKEFLNDSIPRPALFMSLQRASMFKKKLENVEIGSEAYFKFRYRYAKALFRGGKTDMAIKMFEAMIPEYEKQGDKMKVDELQNLLAIAWLRYGEQVNCIMDHSQESCIYPIKGSGIYKYQDGPRNAIKQYLKILEANPGNIEAKWLINIAYMTSGMYPDSVPAQYLMEPFKMESAFDPGHFKNIAMQLGITDWNLAGGGSMEDFNGDGYLDIMLSGMRLDNQLKLYFNKGDGTFEDVTDKAGLTGQLGGLNFIHGDVNNDGFVDVFVLRGGWMRKTGQHPNSLLINNGDGTFTDKTREAGVLTFNPTQAAAFADFNLDGWLDIVVANESQIGEERGIELFMNNQDGTFTNKAQEAGINVSGYYKGVNTGDINNDGYPEIYISDFLGENVFFENQFGQTGKLHFEDITTKAGVSYRDNSFPLWFWDINNDGWEDLMVFNYDFYDQKQLIAEYAGEKTDPELDPGYYINNGDGTFANKAIDAGLNKVMFAMGCNFGDMDNDGYLDFYVGTGNPFYQSLFPNRMFRNFGDGHFEEVTTKAGLGHLQKGHGIAFGDIDHDGDQDILANMGGAFSGDIFQNALYENPGNGNGFFVMELRGTKSNRMAVGARVKIILEENGNEKVLYRTINTGSSFGGNSLRLEVGIGLSSAIKKVEINWPNGQNQWITYTGFEPGKAYKITEGKAEIATFRFEPFTFQYQTGKHNHPKLPIQLPKAMMNMN